MAAVGQKKMACRPVHQFDAEETMEALRLDEMQQCNSCVNVT
jgi:hypothetical protein